MSTINKPSNHKIEKILGKFIFLFCLLLTSCNSKEKTSDEGQATSEEFTYFDNKTYSNLVSLENDLINNWMVPDDIYEGYYNIRSDMGIKNFGKNESIRKLLLSNGKQFVYDMNCKHHLIYRRIVELLLAADAFLENKYAIYNGYNDEEDFGMPIYFGNTWWAYDNWEYSHSGNYDFYDSDVGKRVLATLSAYVLNSYYDVGRPWFYVNKDAYDLQTYTFTNTYAYAYVKITELSTGQSFYYKYEYFMEFKTVRKIGIVENEHRDAITNNLMMV